MDAIGRQKLRPMTRAICGLALCVAVPITDPARCRDALANYNNLVAAIHAAIRDYERCIMASLGHEKCGGELIELQVTHREFEPAVIERAEKCRGLE